MYNFPPNLQTILNTQKQTSQGPDDCEFRANEFCIFRYGSFLISGINTCPIFFDKHYGVRRLSGPVMGFI